MAVIYGLRCPVENRIRYIGKAVDPHARLQHHLLEAKHSKAKYHRLNWLRGLVAAGVAPDLVMLLRVPQELEWTAAERFFIASATHFGFSLVNSTIGGEGLKSPTVEVAAKISDAKRSLWATSQGRAMYLSTTQNEVSKTKRQQSCVRSRSTEESRAKASAHSKDLWSRPGMKEIKSANSKAGWQDPVKSAARRLAMSEGRRAAWADPEKRARQLAAMHSPECKAKLSAAMTARHAKRKANGKADSN